MLSVIDSTISGNTAGDDGGGLSSDSYFYYSQTFVINSTISENVAVEGGGGIEVDQVSTAEVVNSTISGNEAALGGGLYVYYGDVILTNTTFSDNSANYGGGVYLIDGTGSLTNTIIANSNGDDCVLAGTASIDTNVNNLIEDGTCNPLLSGDPNLGPLQDNGGLTETHALLSGSIAIDAGDNAGAAGLGFDQRGPGFDRIVNEIVDIGAFEVQLSPPPTSVPEPSSLMGLAILGMGALTLRKRKLAQRKKTKDKDKS